MSEPYQIFVLIPDGFSCRYAVFKVNNIVLALGGEIDVNNSLLILNDVGDEEFEPYYVDSSEKALETLSKWLTYGSVVYFMPHATTVTYLGEFVNRLINAIAVSILEGVLSRGEPDMEYLYKKLAQHIHDDFSAKRTIMDWGIEYQGFDWREEITRLRNGVFEGSFSMIDIKRM